MSLHAVIMLVDRSRIALSVSCDVYRLQGASDQLEGEILCYQAVVVENDDKIHFELCEEFELAVGERAGGQAAGGET